MIVGGQHSHVAELLTHSVLDLGNDVEMNGLALTDATHTVGALRIVTERHVLADGEHGTRTRRLLNVHAGRVHLVVEREAAVGSDAALLELHRATARAQQNHLAVVAVEVHDALHPLGQVAEQKVRHLLVVHAGDEGASVDQRMERRLGGREVAQQAACVPVMLDRGARDTRRRQYVDDATVATGLILARAEIERQQVRRRAREADALAKENAAAELVAARRDLELLKVHRRREHVLAQIVVHELR